jgi:penicillin amidase
VKSLLRFLRYGIGAIVLLASLALLGAWWVAHSSLPQLDGEASLRELREEVSVTRDRWGIPRIRAQSLRDLLVAQGYVLAQDRLWQMDLIRRAAAGELSDIFGPATLEVDKSNRDLGLALAADREIRRMDAESLHMLEAYASGVNQYIRERGENLPYEFRVLRYKPAPWTPRDSALVGAYMYRILTTSWDTELNRARITARLGPQLAGLLYVQDSPLDHFIVGAQAPANERRTPSRAAQSSLATSPLGPAVRDVLRALGEETELVAGSNNWVVNGTRTVDGKPMLANDTHLRLELPCIWYIAHLTAPGWNVKGFTLPGTPLIIVGHNERIAWGLTNNGADVQDLYIEQFNPANPRQYQVNGNWVEAEVRREIIRVKGLADVAHEVVVTRHGPIMAREGTTGYALRWVATEPGGLSIGYPYLGRAQNWQEFRRALQRISGPAQNIVYADVDGNIGFSVAANIPSRKKGLGEVPMPGATGEYDWNGFIPFEELPVAFNPPEGAIATANARVVGPGYKRHLTDQWVSPYRTARIYELLASGKKFRPEDFIHMQTDILSTPHRLLAEHLMNAARRFQPKDARARELIGRLPAWNGEAGILSSETAFLEFTRRILRRRILETQLGADFALYQWERSEMFLQNVLKDRPEAWLPKEHRRNGRSTKEGYDEFLLASADAAIAELIAGAEQDDRIEDWHWGRYIALQILHPFGRSGFLRRHLSIGPVPQAGAAHSVKQTGRTFGPAMRFVADLGNLDSSMMNISVGQSGQFLSRHYRDQFPEWYEGKGVASSFSDAVAEKAGVHQLKLIPARAL